MKCPQCGEADVRTQRENRSYRESGLDSIVLVDIEVKRCPSCGAEFVSIPRVAELHKTIALALIDKAARFTPAEIKFLRKFMGWSGVDFARHLHVDPATVSRWESRESPQSMGESNELVLRLAVALGQRVNKYSEERLAEVARENVEPLRLKLRASKQGWQMQEAA